MKFDGTTYEAKHDEARLTGQIHRIKTVMADGNWYTLAVLAEKVKGSEAGVSARLRDLRKARFGGHAVERRRVDGGLFEYKLLGREVDGQFPLFLEESRAA